MANCCTLEFWLFDPQLSSHGDGNHHRPWPDHLAVPVGWDRSGFHHWGSAGRLIGLEQDPTLVEQYHGSPLLVFSSVPQFLVAWF